MEFHVGTLRLPSLETESPCITILQGDQVYGLVSATCLTPYFSKQEIVNDINLNKIISSDFFSAEITDIRSISSFNNRPKENWRQNKRVESGSSEIATKQSSDFRSKNLDVTKLNYSGSAGQFPSVDVEETSNTRMDTIVTFGKPKHDVEKSLSKNGELIFTTTDIITSAFHNSDSSNSLIQILDKECFSNTDDDIIPVRPCLVYTIPGVEQTLRKIFLSGNFIINEDKDVDRDLFFKLASTIAIFGNMI